MKRKDSDPQVKARKRKRTCSETEATGSPKEPFNLKELSKRQILECISAIFHLTQEQLKETNSLLAEEAQPLFMQVTSVRVPEMPRRQMRILLPYSIAAPDDEVALFVCDLERGRRKDYEPTVEHYKNLLDKHGCTRVNEIIPMNRVKTEFDQFELKKKLLGSYDHFLVDGRIAGHMSHLLGKLFYKRRKLPTSIRMEGKDLKHEIDYALRKTSMELHSHGDTHVMQIGNTSMKQKRVLKNILAACEELSKNYPGGWANVRALRLKGATTLSLPFYVTLKNKNTVNPRAIAVQPKRPKAYRDVEGELSTFVGNTTVTVKPEGTVILNKHKKKNTKEEKSEKNTEGTVIPSKRKKENAKEEKSKKNTKEEKSVKDTEGTVVNNLNKRKKENAKEEKSVKDRRDTEGIVIPKENAKEEKSKKSTKEKKCKKNAKAKAEN
ncbi:PREDICTED: ribosomal L1 domain-containing protein 1 [Wasmannia auropunctata]|uniref:ribosomal L1 domain-containing protein 1 n=1 Tax=Wasmannia auropunctata TaxID=64793 RepID=UPI0005F0BA4F|nr:PREDICTED: ribosomal L1 domain-containing protein 1 [Wasmannia auropunctata]